MGTECARSASPSRFRVGLVAASPEIKRIGAPTMGIGILLGRATAAVRLWSSDLSGAEESPAF